MLYHFLYPLASEFSVFNVFRYITFRSVWALLTALVLTILIGPWFIRFLQRLKFGQYILEDVNLHSKKAGTPTMGGLLIAFSLVTSVLLWADLTNIYIWLSLLAFLGFACVGLIDDGLKIWRKNNRGLNSRNKLLGQILVATTVMFILVQHPAYSTVLSVPVFKNVAPDLGWLYLVFAICVMVGASNGVNLTDGLDGLAIGPAIVTGICFAIFIYVAGNSQLAKYLQIPGVPGVGEVTVFCGALVGASLGFLWFNAYPAQVFMGDVGSLSLGGTLGFLAVLAKQELILIIVGGIFVAEAVSVILQVGYFKVSGGKRIFRMAPLHHHFELKGIPESKIIIRFWIVSVILGLAALSILKLR
ncbi:phospho-N-acetylmuramoyl-pentapeptide-transferase [Desulfovibrio litoralis]|uniref:Phospho-N-acetylmuramoyl-pentapeptide-transferase n=1 Tax=Desulfovibrio litoralis DSM 11393 TaxID=1121455 RepID=A0A1M7SLP3_9BACT|nr:phospho-N-acetylmuramoyl-pentapeptide-transferase [Desulfovibrio litoralis]SHN59348.1 Phospho-N-acetylmuramoyl-pentapeptide-transferase [Desulfovibrio litoralis DSM 11393]